MTASVNSKFFCIGSKIQHMEKLYMKFHCQVQERMLL